MPDDGDGCGVVTDDGDDCGVVTDDASFGSDYDLRRTARSPELTGVQT